MTTTDQKPEMTSPNLATNSWKRVYGFILLIALLLVALGWQWVDSRSQMKSLQEELGKRLLESDLKSKESNMIATDTRNSLHNVETKLSIMENKLLESQNQQIALEALYQELSRNRDEWALAEIEQILLIANQQLQLAGNVKAAVIAMQIVDSRLQRLDRPQLLRLRKAVNEDIERLNKLPTPDTTGIVFRLDNLVASIDTLPLAMEVRPKPEKTAETQAPPNESTWARLVREIWQEMKQIVHIQSLEKPEVPLLSPEQVFFLRENVKLRLLSARLALFARDDNSFKADVKFSEDWIKRYFDAESQSVINSQASLRELAQSEINIEVPDISGSLEAARQYRVSRGRSAP